MRENTHPPIWRRMILPEKIRFDDFHKIIQMVFGWEDIHRHQFTFANRILRLVSQNEEEDHQITLLETESLMDDYIHTDSWIRYTYNFREGFKHKITFEKIVPDYKHRYATIIKAKGNNIEDDSYVYDEDEPDFIPEEFSVEKTNSILKEFKIPQRKSYIKITPDDEIKRLHEINNKLAEEIQRYKEEIDKNLQNMDFDQGKPVRSKPLSKMEKTLQDFMVFALGKSMVDNYLEGSSLETPYLKESGLEAADLENAFKFMKDEIFILEVNSDTKPLREHLEKLTVQDARTYCKYLQIPYTKTSTKKVCLDQIVKFLQKDMEYFLWLFTPQEWTDLETLVKFKGRELVSTLNVDAMVKAISIGLLHSENSTKGNTHTLKITVATELEAFIKSFSQTKQKKVFAKIQGLDRKLAPILTAYGMVDLESYRQMANQYWQVNMSDTEFNRYIYWHGLFGGLLSTFDSHLDGKTYAYGSDINVDFAIRVQEYHMKGRPYKPRDKKTIVKIPNGFNEIYPCWNGFIGFLFHHLKLDEETVLNEAAFTYMLVINGASSTELIHSFLHDYSLVTMEDYKDLWFFLFQIVLETGLVGLKGYSRREYMEFDMGLPELLPMVTNKKNVRKSKKTTHIYELSLDQQWEIFMMAFQPAGEAAKNMEAFMRRHGHQNDELNLFLAQMYEANGQYREAKKILNQLKIGNKNQDQSINDAIMRINLEMQGGSSLDLFLRDLNEENFNPLLSVNNVVPFQSKKQAKSQTKEIKIGRNDPCPCGSGKKYKNCCGKI